MVVRVAYWTVLALVAPVLGFGLVAIDRLWPPTPRDIAWLSGRARVPDDEAVVLRRYLQRHRVHRFVGGLLAAVAVGIFSVRWDAEVTADSLLFWGIAGVLAGTLSAESFRLAPRAGTEAVASLEPHHPAPRPDLVLAARVLVVITAAAAVVLAAWLGDSGAMYFAGAGVVALAIGELTRARIVGRRRPVLSERARALDARIRQFAGESVAWLELSAAVLAAGGVVGSLPTTPTWVDTVRGLGAFAALLAAAVLARRASPRPPRRWRPAT